MPRLVLAMPPMPQAQPLLDARPDVETVILDRPSAEALRAELGEADGLVLGITPFGAPDLDAAPRLRVVSRFGVGYDSVDVPALTARGVPLTVAGEANAETVADHALALMLAVMHRVPLYDRRVKSGGFADRQFTAQADLWRKTVLLVGFGRIGRRVARRLAGFETRVLVSDPFIDAEEIASRGAEPVEDVAAAMAEVDLVSLHMPALLEGRPYMGEAEFARMKPGAWFVNVSRGTLVDEPALHDALSSGHLAGAGLDVFRREPVQDDNPLLTLDNVVLTPHTAAATDEGWNRMSVAAVRNALDGINGRPDQTVVVNPEALG
jgi:D-3-phosphoglycerate dehydrogenase